MKTGGMCWTTTTGTRSVPGSPRSSVSSAVGPPVEQPTASRRTAARGPAACPVGAVGAVGADAAGAGRAAKGAAVGAVRSGVRVTGRPAGAGTTGRGARPAPASALTFGIAWSRTCAIDCETLPMLAGLAT
ncbi:hypothetical protein GCM10025868_41710 [Angustibacter aerolatus]|uniref:Uncharacterized protein n=1 Tax=Angustibacter aerolatus TaxID=1162965 RepID=A0ABQ6JMY7_9ACTN|nr:hypothetical protein GCM10025868_41710 [Angustibacter aerolatus]